MNRSIVGRPVRVLRAHRITTVLVGVALTILLSPIAGAENPQKPLFDGKTLDGWEALDADRTWWNVVDGTIAGGSLTKSVPHNTFLTTKKSFDNFDLRLKIRISGTEGFINSGIQIRSVRKPDSSEMIGYQVDAGNGWWGKLYDESRRNKVVGQAADLAAVNKVVKEDGWNAYRIRAEGRRIRSWINDVPALDYTETDANIALDGHIGIQAHGGGKVLVQVKDVTVEELPPTPDAPTWKKIGIPGAKKPKAKEKPAAKKRALPHVGAQFDIQSDIRSAEEEWRGFTVPDGFEVELVASESEGIGKFVAIAFDAAGRMWTMTATEYPVDANENAERSRQLFAAGGQDKVLVYDKPYGDAAAKPRVFVDGLVMPLGILPYKDGVFVQYSHDIRFYRDTTGDGKADQHEVILTGFGVEDSHLFPHQFTRRPGGWIFTAQGLFNSSTVRRPGGIPFANGLTEVTFNHTKLARFTLDGSLFENLTAGPNNIWGLTISREGETWLQEANDLGYPVIPYEPGAHYSTGSHERLRPYQPKMPPPLAPPKMGGTGLSGLALADDRDGWPAPWGLKGASADDPRMFYIANPIISRIQAIRATPKNGRYEYEKLPDFLISEDPRFRPVALLFGPDGCLYIVDWYNKIISHNEVSRNHPDRDKKRGRIWRVRHKSQSGGPPVDLTKLKNKELLAHLGSPNARIADLAWQQIEDRGAIELAPDLVRLVEDKSAAIDRRLGALWALEGLQTVETELLQTLAKDLNANIRHEAVRVAAAQPRSASDFYDIAAPLVHDPEPKVRAALGNALRRVANPDSRVIGLMGQLGRPTITGEPWAAYDRAFERCLARWAMELNASAVATFLESPAGKALPLENRMLATLALGGRESALRLARLIPELERPLSLEEVRVLAHHFQEPAVTVAFEQALAKEDSRRNILTSMLKIRTNLDTSNLHDAISRATDALWMSDSSPQGRQFALQVAGAFHVTKLEKEIAAYASAPHTTDALKLAALRALREMGSSEVDALFEIASNQTHSAAIQSEALAVLAASKSSRAAGVLLNFLPDLEPAQRTRSLEQLTATKSGALALLNAIESDSIEQEDVPISVLERMNTLLAGNPQMEALWGEYTDRLQYVLKLSGGNNDVVGTPVSLGGPFTVESWVRLMPGISNDDGILGSYNGLDMNFHEAHFRVWLCNEQRDIVVAKNETTPETWTHYAVTRDASGVFRIYVNGELDAQSKGINTDAFAGLIIGRTIPWQRGTSGRFAEYRVWNMARTANEIRDNFDRSFTSDAHPQGLIHHFTGKSWGKLYGKAHVTPSLEAPALLTAAQALAQREKFAKYGTLAEKPGNHQRGKLLFTSQCLNCHQLGGKGGQIAPPLDGVGLKETESLLRNILTPNAAMEGGYRKFRVLTKDGRLLEGFLVSRDADAVVLRQVDLADQRIPQSNIHRASFAAMSLMPEGLLESLKPQQVSDLFAYMRSLK